MKSSIDVTVKDGVVSYELDLKAYDFLREDHRNLEDLQNPRILVLLLLPRKQEEWIEQDEERLIVRKCAYWVCLEGQPQTDNETSITIDIPRRNFFTVPALQGIMDTLKRGGNL
jgi:hypothetical protein